IPLHQIVRGQCRPVAPRPADGYAGVVKVVNQIVRDAIVGRLPDPDADGALKHLTTVMDVAVGNFVVPGLLGGRRADGRFTQANTARTEIAEFATRNPVRPAAARQLQAVGAEIRERASLKHAIPRPFAPDGAGHSDRGLRKSADLAG